jgi:DNA-binding NtrC family response regulator
MASLLIVDDDETILDVLFELFSDGHVCSTAPTAEEALKQLRSQDYDVVITDISMPGMSGEDLLGFIKVYRPKTPVLFISGSAGREHAERLLTRGAFDYLLKPFSLEDIAERVARTIEYRRRLDPNHLCRN